MNPRQEKAAEARRLKDAGLPPLDIAARLGIRRSYVYELLNDPDGVKVGARKRKAGGTCEVCGGPTTYGRPGTGPYTRCQAHSISPELSAARMRELGRPRRERILQLWNQGATIAEIAADLGTTDSAVGVTMHSMRKEGWDLPHRRDGSARLKKARAQARWQQIHDLWAQGLSGPLIAGIMGTSPGAIHRIISRMRQQGWDMPYRRHRSVQM